MYNNFTSENFGRRTYLVIIHIDDTNAQILQPTNAQKPHYLKLS